MKADILVYTLLIIYVIAATLYLIEGNLPKFLYFVGSTILTIGILLA